MSEMWRGQMADGRAMPGGTLPVAIGNIIGRIEGHPSSARTPGGTITTLEVIATGDVPWKVVCRGQIGVDAAQLMPGAIVKVAGDLTQEVHVRRDRVELKTVTLTAKTLDYLDGPQRPQHREQ